MVVIWVCLGLAVLAGSVFGVRKIFSVFVEHRISDYQNDLIEKHCEEVESMYRQVRGWRHDYKHHIQTMKAHLALKQYGELEQYLDELDTDLVAVDTVVKTGNVRIDAVLNGKIGVARARDIEVHAKAIVPEELPVSEVDLCVIIGNLMDNAIEACQRTSEGERRFIRVYMDILKEQLYIYVFNSMGDTIKRHGKTYVSTKPGDHGFGLMRVDKVVERYHGYLNRQHEEGVFVTEIMLGLGADAIRA